jgi:hypothetical protein
MTTIIINEKTKKGKIILELIRELGAGKIMGEAPAMNEVTRKAIEEAMEGKTIRCNSFEDYLEKVNK